MGRTEVKLGIVGGRRDDREGGKGRRSGRERGKVRRSGRERGEVRLGEAGGR